MFCAVVVLKLNTYSSCVDEYASLSGVALKACILSSTCVVPAGVSPLCVVTSYGLASLLPETQYLGLSCVVYKLSPISCCICSLVRNGVISGSSLSRAMVDGILSSGIGSLLSASAQFCTPNLTRASTCVSVWNPAIAGVRTRSSGNLSFGIIVVSDALAQVCMSDNICASLRPPVPASGTLNKNSGTSDVGGKNRMSPASYV